jgi:hypothetical protein
LKVSVLHMSVGPAPALPPVLAPPDPARRSTGARIRRSHRARAAAVTVVGATLSVVAAHAATAAKKFLAVRCSFGVLMD